MNAEKKKSAIFLDRDGTINVDADYLSHPDQLELLEGSAEAVREINTLGLLAVVITNQSGVARGYFDEEAVAAVNRKLSHLLAAEGASIDAFYYCPHHPEKGIDPYRVECLCRKPATGMVDSASEELNIEPAKSYMIGDKAVDMELARKSGMKGILVKTGYGKKTLSSIENGEAPRPDFTAEDLLHAVSWIKSEEENKKIE